MAEIETQNTSGEGGGEKPSVGKRIGSPHFVEATRNEIISVIGRACARDDIHVDGNGVVSMTHDRWMRLKPAIDAELERSMTIVADEVLRMAALAAPAAKGGTEEPGWKLVPIKPTAEMLEAGAHGSGEDSQAVADGAWETMLAASPPPPAGAAGGGSGDLADRSAKATPGMARALMDSFKLSVGPEGSTFQNEFTTVAICSTCDKAHANLTFLAGLWNAYRSGRLVEASAPTPDLGAQGEPVAERDPSKVRKALLMAREAVEQKVESYRPWADKIAGRVNPWQPVLDAVNEALAEPEAPAASRSSSGVAVEGIAAAIRRHIRLEWRGHDNADINPRSVTVAAEEVLALFAPSQPHPAAQAANTAGGQADG